MKAQTQTLVWGDGGETLTVLSGPAAVAEFDTINFIEDIGKAIADYFTGGAAGSGLRKDVEDALKQLGGDVKGTGSTDVWFGQGGILGGGDPRPASYAIVYFHAWTGDNIKPSFGKVEPAQGILDLGESRYTRGDFQYEYRFLVPLALVPVGKHMFAFGTGDSGTLQDATIGYTVAMEIGPPAASPSIADKYRQLTEQGRWTPGDAKSEELPTPDGIGRYREWEQGSLYWTPGRGAHLVLGAIRDKWASLGGERGVLSYPLTDELPTPDGVGRFNHFQGGSLYWRPEIGAHEVHGAIRERWASLGWERGWLGYPVTDETALADGSRFNNFEGGSIRWTPRLGVEESHAAIQR